MIPGNASVSDTISGVPVHRNTIGRIAFRLAESGLVGDIASASSFHDAGDIFIARYGTSAKEIEFQEAGEMRAIFLTQTGEQLAQLYSPKPNSVGRKLYKNWLKSLANDKVRIKTL